MLQAVLQPGMGDNPAKFEETWNTWEHQGGRARETRDFEVG